MEYPKENIAEKMKKFRKIKNMSQEQLAKLSGINLSTIKKYECGFRNPKPDQIEKIAAAFDVSIHAFISFDINSIGDVLSLLIKLDEQTNLSFAYEKDIDGQIISDTIAFSFDNTKINDALKLYLQLKEKIKKENTAGEPNTYPHSDYSYLIDELLLDIE